LALIACRSDCATACVRWRLPLCGAVPYNEFGAADGGPRRAQ
jgi:hypothetical protein